MKKPAIYGVLSVGAFLTLFPYLLVVLTTFKTRSDLYSTKPWLPAVPPSLDSLHRLADSGFLTYVGHTALMTAVLTVGQLTFTTFAAYAFARMEFRGREVLFWCYLATMMVPNVVTMIPLFLIMRQLHLVNTWFGLLAPYILGTPYGIFLMRQFFRTIPTDLEDAARIDGAGPLTVLWRILLPLSRPALGTLAIITTVQSWNNFLWPLIISSGDDTKVATVAIATLRQSIGGDYNLMMAGSLVALFPMVVIFLSFQRFIVRSVVLTGLK
ncbi:carbohydrate ABC transporter permease [Streptomyces sp. NBC_01198]|uniref:carbohydrate ABC transporter permease n=1 Tax=Streptomyces sp. NBC_01198 TaxID=2903769 RepID=UPI002E12091F|nr:carbohydrate ABC transporter permease [Streptomyces sp. NBC_01198]